MAQTEETQAFSALALRFDLVAGETIGATMSAPGCVVSDQLIYAISRATDLTVATERITTITFGTDSFTSTANLSGLNVELLWHNTSA